MGEVTLGDERTQPRKAPTSELQAKAAPGMRSVTCRENLAGVEESSSMYQCFSTAIPQRSLTNSNRTQAAIVACDTQ